eukprot:944377-Pyramimonas_sp.AAC.1
MAGVDADVSLDQVVSYPQAWQVSNAGAHRRCPNGVAGVFPALFTCGLLPNWVANVLCCYLHSRESGGMAASSGRSDRTGEENYGYVVAALGITSAKTVGHPPPCSPPWGRHPARTVWLWKLRPYTTHADQLVEGLAAVLETAAVLLALLLVLVDNPPQIVEDALSGCAVCATLLPLAKSTTWPCTGPASRGLRGVVGLLSVTLDHPYRTPARMFSIKRALIYVVLTQPFQHGLQPPV